MDLVSSRRSQMPYVKKDFSLKKMKFKAYQFFWDKKPWPPGVYEGLVVSLGEWFSFIKYAKPGQLENEWAVAEASWILIYEDGTIEQLATKDYKELDRFKNLEITDDTRRTE